MKVCYLNLEENTVKYCMDMAPICPWYSINITKNYLVTLKTGKLENAKSRKSCKSLGL